MKDNIDKQKEELRKEALNKLIEAAQFDVNYHKEKLKEAEFKLEAYKEFEK